MRISLWKKDEAVRGAAGAAVGALLGRRKSLKLLVAALGGLGLSQVAAPRPAQATYTPGSPSDTIDTNLTVQGNLVVNQSLGIGASTPQGKLDVAGAIAINGTTAIGADGVVKASYYAQ